METLMIDRSKLKTIKNYAKQQGITVQAVYRMIREDRVKVVILDGKKFIAI